MFWHRLRQSQHERGADLQFDARVAKPGPFIENPFEPGYPRQHRTVVQIGIRDVLQDRGAGKHLTALIVGSRETAVRVLKVDSSRREIERQAANASPLQEPAVVRHSLSR